MIGGLRACEDCLELSGLQHHLFCYATPFEQIRNDVCLHHLPVHLVGNGGGYGYGVMGSTHHAIEDYGVLLALQGMKAFVPAFDADLDEIIPRMQQWDGSVLLTTGTRRTAFGLRLARVSTMAPPHNGEGPVIVVAGPLAGSILNAVRDLETACGRSCGWYRIAVGNVSST